MTDEATGLRCCLCASSATHQIVMGMPLVDLADEVAGTPWQRLGGCVIGPGTWTAECLTCGQRETAEGGAADFMPAPAPDRTVARAITRYAARCREQLDQATTSVISHAGLWLLLASAAHHATGSVGPRSSRSSACPPTKRAPPLDACSRNHTRPSPPPPGPGPPRMQ